MGMNWAKVCKIYIIVSCLFIGSCFVYYGGRFMYYYQESHGKKHQTVTDLNELLTDIENLSMQGDGLQAHGDGYLYIGNVTNNYVFYSGFMWRILNIDAQGRIQMITDEAVTTLPFTGTQDNRYENSLLRRYLTPVEGEEDSGVFYSLLNDPETYLVPNQMCTDQAETYSEVLACTSPLTSDYVGLINVNQYILAGGVDSFLNVGIRQWTLTSVGPEPSSNAFYIFEEGGIGSNTTSNDDNYSFGVRPMVTLKAHLDVTGGNGSEGNPYRIEPPIESTALNEQYIGSYFILDEQLFRIIGVENGAVKAMMQDVIRDENGAPIKRAFDKSSPVFSLNEGSIGYYLNHTWYNGLEHKSYLTKGSFGIGPYTRGNRYASAKVRNKTVKAYVGLPEMYGLFTTNTLGAEDEDEIIYWTTNYKNKTLKITWAVRNGNWLFGNFSKTKFAIRPVIYLKESIQITGGYGTSEQPFTICDVSEVNGQ